MLTSVRHFSSHLAGPVGFVTAGNFAAAGGRVGSYDPATKKVRTNFINIIWRKLREGGRMGREGKKGGRYKSVIDRLLVLVMV